MGLAHTTIKLQTLSNDIYFTVRGSTSSNGHIFYCTAHIQDMSNNKGEKKEFKIDRNARINYHHVLIVIYLNHSHIL